MASRASVHDRFDLSWVGTLRNRARISNAIFRGEMLAVGLLLAGRFELAFSRMLRLGLWRDASAQISAGCSAAGGTPTLPSLLMESLGTENPLHLWSRLGTESDRLAVVLARFEKLRLRSLDVENRQVKVGVAELRIQREDFFKL